MALIASAVKQGGATAPINTVGASLIVLFTEDFTSGGSTPTDSAGNVWTKVVSNGTGAFGTIWKNAAPITSASHTFTATGSFPAISVAAFSGIGDLDTGGSGVSFNSGTTAGATTVQTGLVTPSVPGSLVIFGCGDAWALPLSVNVGTIIPPGALGLVGGTSFANGLAYEIQTTIVARNPTFTFPSNRANAAIAVFKPSIPFVPISPIAPVGLAPPFFMGHSFLQPPSFRTTDAAYSATQLRVSMVFRETLLDGPGTVRIAMFVREVLRSNSVTPNVNVQPLGPPFRPPFQPNHSGIIVAYPTAPPVTVSTGGPMTSLIY